MKYNASINQGLDPVRSEQAKVPGDDSAPVVSNEEDLVDGEGVEEADEVSHDVEDGVTGGGGRRVGVTVTAEVGDDGSVTEGRERKHLVAP